MSGPQAAGTSRLASLFPRGPFLIGLLFFGLVFFSFTTVAAVLRIALGAFLLVVVVRYGTLEWKRLWSDPVLRPLLLFWGWMGISSGVVELFVENNYAQFWENAGFKSVIFLLDRWNLAGLLLTVACWGLIRSEGRGVRRPMIRVLFLILLIGLMGGYIPYVAKSSWQTGEPLETFGRYYNTSAILLNAFIPFTLAGFLHAKRGRMLPKGTYLALFYAGLLAVYLTQSRGGFLSLLAGLLALGAVFLWFHFSLKNLIVAGLIVLGGIGLIVSLPEASRQRTSERYEESSFALSGRVTNIWPHALHLIAQRPLLGYSLGSYYPESVESDPTKKNPHAHNHWLQLTFEGGSWGWVCFCGSPGGFSAAACGCCGSRDIRTCGPPRSSARLSPPSWCTGSSRIYTIPPSSR